jgi:hypothetical protein
MEKKRGHSGLCWGEGVENMGHDQKKENAVMNRVCFVEGYIIPLA